MFCCLIFQDLGKWYLQKLRLMQEYAHLDRDISNDTMNAPFRAYFLVYFSRSRQIIKNILRFVQEYAQLE